MQYNPMLADEECYEQCSVDHSEKCGAPWKMSVYRTGIKRKRSVNVGDKIFSHFNLFRVSI